MSSISLSQLQKTETQDSTSTETWRAEEKEKASIPSSSLNHFLCLLKSQLTSLMALFVESPGLYKLQTRSRLTEWFYFLLLLLQTFPTFPGLCGFNTKASGLCCDFPRRAKSRWAEAGSSRVMKRNPGRRTEATARGAWGTGRRGGPGREVHTLALI